MSLERIPFDPGYSQPANTSPIPELYVSPASALALKTESTGLPSWDLTLRQICDLELLMNGGFQPLAGFLTEIDYHGVLDTMRLRNGALWPIPIALDVSEAFSRNIELGQDIADGERHAADRVVHGIEHGEIIRAQLERRRWRLIL